MDVCYDYYDRYTVVYTEIFISYTDNGWLIEIEKKIELYIKFNSDELDRPINVSQSM